MKKDTVDLMNFLGLRVGDKISINYRTGFTHMLVDYNPETQYVDLVDLVNYCRPSLSSLIGLDFEIIERKKTYADKWDNLRKVCDEMLNDFDNYGTNMGIAQVLAYTRKALMAMEMDTELAKLNHELGKCISIDQHDEGDV